MNVIMKILIITSICILSFYTFLLTTLSLLALSRSKERYKRL